MGQKVSDLRGYMLAMDPDPNNSKLLASSEPNGNDRFEMIYGNRNEPGTSADFINGNISFEEEDRKKWERLTLKNIRSKRGKDGASTAKRRNNWAMKLNCARLRSNTVEAYIPEGPNVCGSCVCTGYRRTQEEASSPPPSLGAQSPSPPVIDLSRFNPDDFPIEDCDERARLERAREMAEGVEPPPGFTPGGGAGTPVGALSAGPLGVENLSLDHLAVLFQARLGLRGVGHGLSAAGMPEGLIAAAMPVHRIVHTQVDYVHCLVPDLLEITALPFYWGKMDRYEAERLLEGRPEGTFLLRDSAQEEYLFSVSFRKYDRSLHARIEQWNHRFSFDSHDPGVFASPTVCGLIEHYKDSPFCMFFEPMLTLPLNRNFPFPLQHLCRAAVCSQITYDNINKLHLPKILKVYLKEYHYKQRVRVRWLDPDF